VIGPAFLIQPTGGGGVRILPAIPLDCELQFAWLSRSGVFLFGTSRVDHKELGSIGPKED